MELCGSRSSTTLNNIILSSKQKIPFKLEEMQHYFLTTTSATKIIYDILINIIVCTQFVRTYIRTTEVHEVNTMHKQDITPKTGQNCKKYQ